MHTPHWFLLTVAVKQERRVAQALRAKGLEVFLPMHTVHRQWSDRVKTYSTPLFACNLFCRFPRTDALMVLKTPNVFTIFECGGKPLPIPDAEIACLRRIVESHYPVDLSEPSKAGDVVAIEGGDEIHGILIDGSGGRQVAIEFDVIGRTVVVKAPPGSLQADRRTSHWLLHLPPDKSGAETASLA